MRLIYTSDHKKINKFREHLTTKIIYALCKKMFEEMLAGPYILGLNFLISIDVV